MTMTKGQRAHLQQQQQKAHNRQLARARRLEAEAEAAKGWSIPISATSTAISGITGIVFGLCVVTANPEYLMHPDWMPPLVVILGLCFGLWLGHSRLWSKKWFLCTFGLPIILFAIFSIYITGSAATSSNMRFIRGIFK